MDQNGHDSDSSEDLTLLRSYLSHHDTPCPGCGYNLRGLGQGSCPECGDSISLAVTNYPSRSGGYSAGLVGMTLSSLLAVFFAAENVTAAPLVSVLSAFVAAWFIRAALRWRRNRASFAGLPRHKKQERVVVCWIGVIVFVLFIFVEEVGAVLLEL